MARRSARLSKRASVNFNESNILDPDTNVIGDEQTHWWRELDDMTFILPSSLYSEKNETARHLNSLSQLNSSDNASEKWWGNLDPSDNDNTASTSPRRNFSAEIVKLNVLDISTSESEKEHHVRKRKTRLKAANRKSSGNAFLNALNNTEITNSSRILRSRQEKISAADTLATDISTEKSHKNNEDSLDASLTMTVLKSKTNIFDRKKRQEMTNENIFQNVLTDISPEKSHKNNEDSSDTSLIMTVSKSKTNIFDRKKRQEVTNKNIFQNVLIESSNLDNSRKELVIAANKSPIRQHIDEDEGNNNSTETIPLSLPLKLSTSGNQNSVSDNVNKSLENSDKSDETNIIIKPKSGLSTRSRKSTENNVFANILEHNTVNKTSQDTDESNYETNIIIKPKSGLSTRSRKSTENNVFANILEHNTVNKTPQDTDESNDETNVIMKLKSGLSTRSRKSIENNVFANILEHNTVNKTLQSIEESADETNIIIKPKSRLLTRSRKSIKDNAFLDILKNDSTTSPGRYNLNQEIDIHEEKSQSLDKSLSLSAKESVNKFQNKADTQYENVIARVTRNSIQRKSKLLSSSKEHFLNISTQEVQNGTQQNSTNLSSASNAFHQLSSSVSLPNSQTLKRLRRSLFKNPSEEILQENEIISTKKSNTVMTNENIVEQNKTGNTTSPSRRFLATKEVVQLSKDRNISNQHSNDFSPLLLLNVSTPENVQVGNKNVSTNNTMPSLTKFNKTNEIISHNNSHDYMDNDLTTPVKSKLNQSERIHSIRVNSRKQSKIPKIANKHTTDLHRHSVERNVEIEEENDINKNLDINNVLQVRSSTRSPRNISTNKDTSSSGSNSDNIDTSLTGRTVQQDISLSKSKTTNMPLQRHDLSKTSIIHNSSGSGLIIKENRKIASRQQSRNSVFQNQQSTSIKTLNNDISHNISKTGLSKTTTLDNFFKVKTDISTDKQGPSNDRRLASSNIFGNAKITEQIRKELQNIKNRELATKKVSITTEKNQRLINAKNTELIKKLQERKLSNLKPTKVVDKAFLVNGKVYRAPKLPRPKFWVTNRLYKFLWKHMESKYKLTTRVKSEKFIGDLSNVVSFVLKSKHYKDYKLELEGLMKEMARLGIIHNRNDFYHFCQDFMPYDFRIKAVPMVLPGNKRNIPYHPELLHTALLLK